MISNFFERENIVKKPTIVPCKKKRKFSRSKSRKRPRTKTQCDNIPDNIEPKVKKSRKTEIQPESIIETIDEDIPLQPVSLMIHVNINIIY